MPDPNPEDLVNATYESLRDCRPRVKQDVLYAKTPNGVIFHNATTGFQITSRSGYEFARKVVPFFDGNNRVAELYDVLPEQHRPMLVSLVGSLLERGFVRDVGAIDVVPEGLDATTEQYFRTQINYIDHYEDGAAGRFLTLRNTRVAVLGSDQVARWAILSLIRNGVREIGVDAALELGGNRTSSITAELQTLAAAGVEAKVDRLSGSSWDALQGYEYVLVAGGDEAAPLVYNLLREGIPDGVLLDAATTIGGSAVVGPLMSSGRAGCWLCAMLRLSGNAEPADAADAWAQLAAGVAVPEHRPTSRTLAAMLGNLLGYEVFRSATGAMRAETQDALIIQNLKSMDVTTEVLLPHPCCPRCVDEPSLSEPLLTATDLTDVEPREEPRIAPADVDRSDGQFTSAQRHHSLFGASAGLFAAYDDADFTQLPLRVGRIRFGIGNGRRRAVAAFDVHNTVGARLRAVRAAARSYVEVQSGRRAVPVTSPDTRRIGAERIATRAASAKVAIAEWLPGTLLSDRRPVLVPAAAVWPTAPANDGGIFHRTGAGLAVAESPAEAMGAGLLGAWSLQRLLTVTAGTARPALVDLASLGAQEQLSYLVKSAANLGITVELLDLSGEDGAPVLLARTAGGWALGAALSWTDAAIDALRDVLGAAQVRQEFPDADLDLGPVLLDSFDPAVLVATEARPASLDRATDWAGMSAALTSAGLDAVAVDVGSLDLVRGGLSALRVLLVDSANR